MEIMYAALHARIFYNKQTTMMVLVLNLFS
jgi:hypothetical protein